MRDLLAHFSFQQFGVCATIIVLFTYSVLLDRDLRCTCDQQTAQCNLYMALPFLIVLVLMLWMNKKNQKAWKFVCCRCSEQICCIFSWVMLRHFFRACLVSLLWVAFVLIDGDWYVCCMNEKRKDLACKDKTNLTAEERKSINELKSWSKTIGFCIVVSVVFSAAMMSLFDWKKFCKTSDCCKQSDCYNKGNLYYKLILEEEKNVLKEVLRKAAKDKLSEKIQEKIRGEDWTECFNVAEELIKGSDKPTLGQDQQTPPGEPQQLERRTGPAAQQEVQEAERSQGELSTDGLHGKELGLENIPMEQHSLLNTTVR